MTFLEQALAVSPTAADRADLHERALVSRDAGPRRRRWPSAHGLGALEARRELGDREAIADATAEYGHAVSFFGTDGERVLSSPSRHGRSSRTSRRLGRASP